MKKYHNLTLIIILVICIIISNYYLYNCNNTKNIENNNINKSSEYSVYRNVDYSILPENIKKTIDIINYNFSKKIVKRIDLVDYYQEIPKWIGEENYIMNMWIILYKAFKESNWFIKKDILIWWDRTDLLYSFYFKWDKLYWVRKTRIEFIPPKWADYSKIDSEIKTDCYISLNNCWDDVLFLKDFIEKLENKENTKEEN